MGIPIKFSKGETVEQRLASIETSLRHFSRRLRTVAKVILPPIPIFASAQLLETDGIIFKGLIPYKGKLNIAGVWIGKFVKRPIVVSFKLANPKGETSVSINCESRFSSRELALTIVEPSMLEIVIEPYDGAEDILVTVLSEVEFSKTRVEQVLLDEILSSYEMAEDIEEITPDE